MHLSNDRGPLACGKLADLAKQSELPSSVENAVQNAYQRAEVYHNDRDGITAVLNAAPATNTIDPGLKRVAVLQETIRDFATIVLPLRLLATRYENVPLQGTDEVVVPYYPLQTAASSDVTSSNVPAYVFGQATSTSMKKITVNKRKYQPLDYSSQDFRRQPWFSAVQLGRLNAQKLGVDIMADILSVVTAANFGAAIATVAAATIGSDDVISIRGACNRAMWPVMGRSLIVDSTVDDSLQKDSAYKLALNIGTTSVIQEGKLPKLSGFDYAFLPNLPSNGEKLIGFAAFQSAILSAFAPVAPADGVRSQLVSYEVVTDPASGVSLNYRHWGVAADDRDYEVIESAYGYAQGVPAALKRICTP
jgi:hypothetical protein